MQNIRPRPSYAPAVVAILLAVPFVISPPAVPAADTLVSPDATALNGAIVLGQDSGRERDRAAAIAGLSLSQLTLSAEAPPSARMGPSRPPGTVEATRDPSPFGYLEFDWKSGVPGFVGPIPVPASP